MSEVALYRHTVSNCNKLILFHTESEASEEALHPLRIPFPRLLGRVHVPQRHADHLPFRDPGFRGFQTTSKVFNQLTFTFFKTHPFHESTALPRGSGHTAS